MGRQTLGYVVGVDGRFGRMPFYDVRLAVAKCHELDQLLAQAGAAQRRTIALTASYHQPDRLRVTEIAPPAYELRAAAQYVRGDVIRVQGKEGVSCGLDISARFGVPLIRDQLRLARERAREFIEFRIPSRKRDVVEFIADVDLIQDDDELLAKASAAAAATVLPVEDFSDWEK